MTNINEFLVIGATGNIGRHVVAALRARGATVRAMSRNPAEAQLPDGVDVVRGDLTDLDTLQRALTGVDAVFLLWPFLSSDGAPGVVHAIAGHARRVVYVSAVNVRDNRSPAENGVWGQVEDAIRRTNLEWTFLRASGFATNTLEWAPAIRAGRPVRIPHPAAARSLIHERDIAEVAVRTLTEPGHAGAAYVLTGPTAITQEEQVRILGETAGQPGRVEQITPEQARATMLTWGDPEFVDGALSYWASLVDTPEQVTRTVEEITGTPARSFEQWARDHTDDLRPMRVTEVATRYMSALRAGRIDLAMRVISPDVVRVAPLETGGERVELHGPAEVMAHSDRLNRDLQMNDIDVDGPFVEGNRFAVKFSFDQTHIPTGRRHKTAKMCLYTVTNGEITREDVFYFDPLTRS